MDTNSISTSLFEWTARSTFLLAGALFLLRSLRHRSASFRHAVLATSFAAVLALPLLTPVLPELPIFRASEKLPVVLDGAAGAHPMAGGDSRNLRWPSESPNRALPWLYAIVGTWALGSTCLLARLLASAVSLRWRCRPRSAFAPDIAIGGTGTSPLCFGVLRPRILLPLDACDWPPDLLDLVIRHERCHLSRRDPLTALLAHLACALQWPNPLVWVAAVRLRRERELACDDLVLATGVGPKSYARALVDIASGRPLAPTAIAMADVRNLADRIRCALKPNIPRKPNTMKMTLALIVTTALVALPLAALRVEAAPAQNPFRTVVIDPGHGGMDGGNPGEKALNLDISLRLAARLRAAGISVLLTRDADAYVSLAGRAKMRAAAGLDSIFVSIHLNATKDPSVSGAEISVSGDGTPDDEQERKSLLLAASLQSTLAEVPGVVDRGVTDASYFVLRNAVVPSVYVSAGYLTNPDERARLENEEYRQVVAEALASAILHYRGS